MFVKILGGVALSVLLAANSQAAAYVQSGVPVGLIKISGSWGLSAFKRADGGVFPGCAYDPTTMWSDASSAYEGLRALLATLLTARAMNAKITVWYNAPDGYCRFETIELE